MMKAAPEDLIPSISRDQRDRPRGRGGLGSISSKHALSQESKTYAVTLAFDELESVIIHFFAKFGFIEKSKSD